MMSASLNHCKKMGAEPGRRFLKQPAAKLELVINCCICLSVNIFLSSSSAFCHKKFYISGSQSGRNHPLVGDFEGQGGNKTKVGDKGGNNTRGQKTLNH